MIILQTNLKTQTQKNCELAMEDNTNNILENEATKRVRKEEEEEKPGFRVGALVLSGALLTYQLTR